MLVSGIGLVRWRLPLYVTHSGSSQCACALAPPGVRVFHALLSETATPSGSRWTTQSAAQARYMRCQQWQRAYLVALVRVPLAEIHCVCSHRVSAVSYQEEGSPTLNKQTYSGYLQDRYGITGDGIITDFVSRQAGHLLLGNRVDLNALVARYGAPLEVAYCPLITTQIDRMHGWATEARERSGYTGQFLYAYATKANFAEEVVRTALNAGAHHETSAASDVVIAHHLWRQGTIPSDRSIFCNGSKDRAYIDAIVALRRAGFENLVPILDDSEELEQFLTRYAGPWKFGVRARFAPDVIDPGHPGGERFGLTQAEIGRIAQQLAGTQHQIVLYHAMVGSQIEDAIAWEARLQHSVAEYAALHALAPSLHMFNFGGGMPTSAYTIDFAFDYAGFLERLMRLTAAACAIRQIPQPTIVGEFGRYSTASHSVFLMEVGSVKRGQGAAPDWMLLNGSLMVTLPDILIVEEQQFVILPLEGWEREVVPARLGGRYTCDSDDFFPRSGQPALMLPETDLEAEPYVLAFFGVGAYQQMISGRGGAHHCLTPEMRRIVIEQDDDALVVREIAPQNLETIMNLLGYPQGEAIEPVPAPRPAVPASVERRPIRESVLAARTPRRRQPTFPPRPVTPRDPRSVTASA